MNLYSRFETDKEIEQTGIDLRYSDDTVLTIARAGGSNKKYLKAAEKAQRKLQVRRPNNEEALEILREIYADCVVLKWEGVTDREGKPLECTKENKLQLFRDLPDLFADIRVQAENADLFRKAELEKDAGN